MKDRYMYGNIDIFSHESKIKIVVDGSILCSFVAEAAVIQRMSAYIDTENIKLEIWREENMQTIIVLLKSRNA